MTRALVIGDVERTHIAALKAKAEAEITDAEAAIADAEAARRFNARFTIAIPHGFRVTYTHERQPAGLFHHLSISVDKTGKSPHPAAVDMILSEFGLKPFAEADLVWLERDGSGAVNVLQRIAP